MRTGAHKKVEALNPLEVELGAVVSYPAWVLGTNSGRATQALIQGAIALSCSLALILGNSNCLGQM